MKPLVVTVALVAMVSSCVSSVEPEAPTREDLAARRGQMLIWLAEYREQSSFPRNRVQPGKVNIFIDENNHYCAVANLMRLDGHDGLVRQTARHNNFIRLADVHNGPLYDWMLSSGLNQEEIAFIQEPYFMEEPEVRWEEQEDQRLKDHFTRVDRELRSNTTASLDTATSRLAEQAVRRAQERLAQAR